MRIAFDIRGLDGSHGGKGVWTANTLMSVLSVDRENDFFLYTREIPNHDFSSLPNVHVVQVSGRGPLWHWKFYHAMLRDKIDTYVATESYIVPFLHDPARLKVALVVHDLIAFNSPAKHQRLATAIEHFTLAKAAAKSRWIFAVSDFTKQDLVQRYPKLHLSHKTSVVHAGVREIFAHPMDSNRILGAQRHHDLGPDYLLMVGTLEPRKNILGALTAYSYLSSQHQKRYPLVIIGRRGWYFQSIFKWVKMLNLESRVVFLESVSDEDLVPLMRGATVFLFPSFYEGFGLPVLEAMQCGVPVLASRASSIPEVGGEAALYVDPSRNTEISDGITRLLDDKKLRKQLRERGLERVKLFSWDRTAELILSAIRQDTEHRTQNSEAGTQNTAES